MGEIFLCIGLWFVFSGVKDIREAKRMPDDICSDDNCYHEELFPAAEELKEGSAVA